MAGWEKEVILTWQTCSNIIIVILVMISLAMTTCLSKGNLWKSMGQSTAKLIREEYLVDFKGVLMEIILKQKPDQAVLVQPPGDENFKM